MSLVSPDFLHGSVVVRLPSQSQGAVRMAPPDERAPAWILEVVAFCASCCLRGRAPAFWVGLVPPTLVAHIKGEVIDTVNKIGAHVCRHAAVEV
jgi:hypothetical protein